MLESGGQAFVDAGDDRGSRIITVLPHRVSNLLRKIGYWSEKLADRHQRTIEARKFRLSSRVALEHLVGNERRHKHLLTWVFWSIALLKRGCELA